MYVLRAETDWHQEGACLGGGKGCLDLPQSPVIQHMKWYDGEKHLMPLKIKLVERILLKE